MKVYVLEGYMFWSNDGAIQDVTSTMELAKAKVPGADWEQLTNGYARCRTPKGMGHHWDGYVIRCFEVDA
jgi:hypothetical protein